MILGDKSIPLVVDLLFHDDGISANVALLISLLAAGT